MNVQDIKAKYGFQADATNAKKSIGGEGERLRKAAQKAVDAVVAATRKAKAACDAYSKALQKAKGPNAAWTTVDFEGIMEDITRGGAPKVWERMKTIEDIKVKYGVSQDDAEGPDVARKRRQEETIRAAEKNISNAIKAYVELAQKFQREHGDSKYVSAAKMRGWIR